MQTIEIVYKSVDELTPYANNPRRNDEAVDPVAASIKEFGFKVPIVLDSEGVIVTGHTRLKAAKKLGLERVPCIIADDLTPEQVAAFRLADNKVAEIAEWDLAMLEAELEDLDFDMEDFGFEMPEIEPFDLPEEITEDEVPESASARCKEGDIWQLGRHRLMCGDSTDSGAVALLMSGEKADMVFTDPPYNVDYASKNEFLNAADKGNRIQKDIAGDAHETDEAVAENLWKPAFQNMRDNADDYCSIYVTMPQGGAHMMMMMAIQAASWQVKHELIWVKNNHVLGRTDYFYKHEPILFGWAKKHRFYGDGEFDKSVWEIDKPHKSDLHPTMKPIKLIANCLLNSSKAGDAVLDVFGGSGSTLIACEETGRSCRMMELDPHYCDIILQRWENLTGQEATLIHRNE